MVVYLWIDGVLTRVTDDMMSRLSTALRSALQNAPELGPEQSHGRLWQRAVRSHMNRAYRDLVNNADMNGAQLTSPSPAEAQRRVQAALDILRARLKDELDALAGVRDAFERVAAEWRESVTEP